ncbi:hypothetical protein BH10PSE1_BH10PSE1_24790 [soil metagenome]
MSVDHYAPEAVTDAFFEAVSGLGPVDLRVLHLAMSRAANLEAGGRGADADTLLLRLLRILQEDSRPTLNEAVLRL